MNSNSNVVIFGRGSIGVRHAKNLKKLNLNPIFLRLQKKRKIPNDDLDVPEIYSVSEALKFNPIGAVISTPTIFHCDHALEFLKENIPVYIEKPLGYKISKENFDELEKYSKTAIIHGGFNLKYSPQINEFKENFFKEKKNIKKIEITWHTNIADWHPWEDFRESYAFRNDLGGGVIHTCSHEINLLLDFFPNAELIKNENFFFKNVCTRCKAVYTEDLTEIYLDLDFMNKKSKQEILVTLNNNKFLKFDSDKYLQKNIQDVSCNESIKDFINCIRKKSIPKSNYEDSKKTYLYCEKLLNEKNYRRM